MTVTVMKMCQLEHGGNANVQELESDEALNEEKVQAASDKIKFRSQI